MQVSIVLNTPLCVSFADVSISVVGGDLNSSVVFFSSPAVDSPAGILAALWRRYRTFSNRLFLDIGRRRCGLRRFRHPVLLT